MATIYTDHLGNKYSSLKDMCAFYGISVSTYKARIKRGWSVQDALEKPLTKYSCRDYLGNEFASKKAMCDAYNIDYRVFQARIKNENWSLEKALTTPVRDDSCVDHLGNKFNSISDMCSFYKIDPSCYKKRIRSGWSVENALTMPSGSKNPLSKIWNEKKSPASKECKDHKGNEYPSFKAMCNAYNMSPNTVYARMTKYKWPLEKALTTPLGEGRRVRRDGISCRDMNGTIYPSVSAMCKKYGVSRSHYQKRIDLGFSLCDALNPKHRLPTKSRKGIGIGKHRATGDFYDHNGNHFTTFKDMCSFYGLKPATVYKRLSTGSSLRDALIIPVHKKVCDHKGKQFDSIIDMCRYYNINHTLYFARVNKYGWSQEKALITPPGQASLQFTSCTDHQGNEYLNLKQMCDAYNVDYNLFLTRLQRDWSIQEALTIPRNMYIGEYRVAECLKRLNVKFYHDCSIKTIFAELDIPVDWNEFLAELKTKLGMAGINWSKKKIQRLRPDFVLYTDENKQIQGVIEFDGEQHQNFVEYFFKTLEEFLIRSDTDFVKQSFWEYMNIPMLRIRYDQVDKIDYMVKDFINNPELYIHNHNTYLSEEEYWKPLAAEKERLNLAFTA